MLLVSAFAWSRGLVMRKDEKRSLNAANQEKRDLCRAECSKNLLDRSRILVGQSVGEVL